ncbi:MAG TPA: ATP-binding protein [Gemmatimonadaceae bacterium]|nr:ATP-binding protein [Gemmatimonadaceae bacterium]
MTHITLPLPATPSVGHTSTNARATALARGTGSVLTNALHSMRRRALRLPLVLKLLGANLLLALAALAILATLSPRAPMQLALTWTALLLSFAVNALLVRLALLPLDELERVARAVASGDMFARVSVLSTADRQVARLAEAFNGLLAGAAYDHARIKHLVRESLRARERERSAVASQLRDGTAQQLSAITLQLAAATAASSDRERTSMIEAARGIASAMIDDVRKIADSVYPGLLGRFGLYPALEVLGRRAAERTGIAVRVDTSRSQRPLPLMVTTALYGAAEEALRNVEEHSCARTAVVTIRDNGREVELVVEDNGTGFDPATAERTFSGIGLFRARELLAHAGGDLTIISAPGRGTKVVATAVLPESE